MSKNKNRLLFLSEKDVKSLVDGRVDLAVEAMYDVFDLIHSGDYSCGGSLHSSHGMQLNYTQKGENALFIAMPGYAGGKYRITGMKWHGPMNRALALDCETNYTLVLNDAVSGKPFCVMEAGLTTALRTAAVNVVAACEMSDKAASSMGIVGPGRINTLFTREILRRRPGIKKILVKGRGKESTDRFVKEILQDHECIDIRECNSIDSLVDEADIVSIMTGFKFDSISDIPRVRANNVHPGQTFLCGAFAYFSEKSLCEQSNRVCDLYEMYESYESELGFPAYEKLSYLGNKFADLVMTKKIDRDGVVNLSEVIFDHSLFDPKLPTFFSSGGIVIEDIVMGSMIYELAARKGMGTWID